MKLRSNHKLNLKNYINHKILHKIGKHWVIISLTMLCLLGAGVTTENLHVNADQQYTGSNAYFEDDRSGSTAGNYVKDYTGEPTHDAEAASALKYFENGYPDQSLYLNTELASNVKSTNMEREEATLAHTPNPVDLKIYMYDYNSDDPSDISHFQGMFDTTFNKGDTVNMEGLGTSTGEFRDSPTDNFVITNNKTINMPIILDGSQDEQIYVDFGNSGITQPITVTQGSQVNLSDLAKQYGYIPASNNDIITAPTKFYQNHNFTVATKNSSETTPSYYSGNMTYSDSTTPASSSNTSNNSNPLDPTVSPTATLNDGRPLIMPDGTNARDDQQTNDYTPVPANSSSNDVSFDTTSASSSDDTSNSRNSTDSVTSASSASASSSDNSNDDNDNNNDFDDYQEPVKHHKSLNRHSSEHGTNVQKHAVRLQRQLSKLQNQIKRLNHKRGRKARMQLRNLKRQYRKYNKQLSKLSPKNKTNHKKINRKRNVKHYKHGHHARRYAHHRK